jgi:GT2 family glycosyltransferase
MNRLHHIKKTLPQNILDNRDYPNVEFVLLDYGSDDGLEDWINDNFQKELVSGLLNFRRTTEPKKYLPSHSKNMVHFQSTGDIVCNLDGDNFTGSGFASYLNKHFIQFPNSFLSADYRNQNWQKESDTFGRIVCRKDDFESIGGYDERMKWYSYEDLDLCERLIRKGIKQYFITNRAFLNTIKHDDEERVGKNSSSEITNIYINHIDPLTSGVIFFFRNGEFSLGTLLDLNKGFGTPVIKEKRWIRGLYEKNGKDKIHLVPKNKTRVQLSISGNTLTDDDDNKFYHITDPTFKKALGMHYAIISNHQVLVNNSEFSAVIVNN